MPIDAFTGGVSADGVKNKAHIKVLVCFMICSSSESLREDDITRICFERELANYFEVCDALHCLISDGIILRDEKTGLLSPTDEARDIFANLTNELPRTVKENTLEELSRFSKLKRRERDSKIEITERDGGWYLTCSTLSGGLELMSVTLFFPSEEYALAAKERFLDNPAAVYKYLLGYFTGSKF